MTPTARTTPFAGTYCFLSEMMFQNGMNSFVCSVKHMYRDDWYVEMVRQVPEIQVEGLATKVRLPVIVHANYCNAKTHELSVRGLWLFDEKAENSSSMPSSSINSKAQCRPYNVSNVFFAKKNFTLELENIETYRLELLKTVLVNGTLLKRAGAEDVYLISPDLARRPIPDGDSFINLGYDWDQVKSVPSSVLFMIPEGQPFPSTSTRPPSKKKNQSKKDFYS
jgi:hypothetical protein